MFPFYLVGKPFFGKTCVLGLYYFYKHWVHEERFQELREPFLYFQGFSCRNICIQVVACAIILEFFDVIQNCTGGIVQADLGLEKLKCSFNCVNPFCFNVFLNHEGSLLSCVLHTNHHFFLSQSNREKERIFKTIKFV